MHEQGAQAGVVTKSETSKAVGHGKEMRKLNRQHLARCTLHRPIIVEGVLGASLTLLCTFTYLAQACWVRRTTGIVRRRTLHLLLLHRRSFLRTSAQMLVQANLLALLRPAVVQQRLPRTPPAYQRAWVQASLPFCHALEQRHRLLLGTATMPTSKRARKTTPPAS
jgi:hypothetical protein